MLNQNIDGFTNYKKSFIVFDNHAITKNLSFIFEYSEPNDLDTIYKVLKKAGEISAASNAGGQPTMEIPVVNIPDYPDRTPRRTLFKALGPSSQPSQGLTAPSTADVSSSGPKMLQISFTHSILIYFVFLCS